jgi:hypothetical protein
MEGPVEKQKVLRLRASRCAQDDTTLRAGGVAEKTKGPSTPRDEAARAQDDTKPSCAQDLGRHRQWLSSEMSELLLMGCIEGSN